jgi:hypothetical protein
VLDKLKELNVEFVVVDNTLKEERINKDVARTDRAQIPINLIYPPNYPDEPAILLDELITPAQVLEALQRMEKIVNGTASQPDSQTVLR